MTVNVNRLLEELKVVLIDDLVTGCGVVKKTHPSDSPVTFHQRTPEQGGELVRVTWSAVPSAAQQADANTIVLAHDGTPTDEEKMDYSGATMIASNPRVLAAVIVRISTHWGGLTPQQKTKLQTDIIDKAAQKLIQDMTGP